MIIWETGWSYAVAGNYDAPPAQAVAGASAGGGGGAAGGGGAVAGGGYPTCSR
ncbi:MAG TPA: hypothetical protein VEA44_19080 [Caulobacter sp.]|nr:hypothetical protein [Caulobacter sp.]